MKFTPEKKTSEFLKNTRALGEVKLAKGTTKQIERQKAGTDDKTTSTAAVNKNPKRASQQKRKEPPAENIAPGKGSSSGENTSKPKVVASFSGRHSSDTMKTDLRGIVSFSDGSIVVMDTQFRNKRFVPDHALMMLPSTSILNA